MPNYSINAASQPQSLVTWNIAHAYDATVSLAGGVTLAAQNQTLGYADMVCRLYFPGDTTESLPTITVNENVYHYDGSTYVYDHINTNTRSGSYNSTYNVTVYPLSGNESMLTGSYDGATNYTDSTLFSTSTSVDDMAHIAREYFDNYQPHGQGTVTITIKRPGQTLNFTSRLLGKTVSQYITSNATIDIQEAHEVVIQTFTDVKSGYTSGSDFSAEFNPIEYSPQEYIQLKLVLIYGTYGNGRIYIVGGQARTISSIDGANISSLSFINVNSSTTGDKRVFANLYTYSGNYDLTAKSVLIGLPWIREYYKSVSFANYVSNSKVLVRSETFDKGTYILTYTGGGFDAHSNYVNVYMEIANSHGVVLNRLRGQCTQWISMRISSCFSLDSSDTIDFYCQSSYGSQFNFEIIAIQIQ